MNAAWKSAVRRKAPLVTRLGDSRRQALAVDARTIDGLLARGVPFHLAAEKKQDERPSVRSVPKRLAQGETLYLVQPHEYMPRLRRFIYTLGRGSGFTGRPFRSFLFRVDVPGREIMGMHDDGETELGWLQFSGERFVTFGTPGAAGRKQSLGSADGRHAGWFKGGLSPGDLLYLPPHAPHEVACRKPSIAVSIYWEPVHASQAAAAWLAEQSDRPLRGFPARGAVAAALRKGAGGVGSAAYEAWRLGRETDDGARDRPPAAGVGWLERPAETIAAWRAFGVLERGREALVRAGGELELIFPKAALPVLAALAHYGAESVAGLQHKSALSSSQLERLLDALHAEGLVTRGELPKIGAFDGADLTGWDYAAQ